MCTSPSFVWVKRGPEWVKIPAPCDLCWSCRENYVSDWVGRCLCEAATSEISVTLSLTYATPENRSEFSHRIVNPHHFQVFMKRLRNAGHKVRYLVAGEYGDTYDRAHFHAILFFKVLKDQEAPAPKLENRKAFLQNPDIAQPLSRQMPNQDMCHIREWPHGHVVADWSCTEKSIRYCCEYINPKNGHKKNGWFSMSKKPSLGAEWFAEKALRNIEWGVMPSTFEYMPPGGKPGKKYIMTGATRRDYLNLITKDRSRRPQMSEWVRATFDKLERAEFKDAMDASVQWPDNHFQERERETDKIMAAQKRSETWQRLRGRYIEETGLASVIVFTSPRRKPNTDSGREVRHVYQDETEFEAACLCAARQSEGSAELFPRRESTARNAVKARASNRAAKRPPTGYDRQGVPYWGEPGRDYLEPFSRRESGPQDGKPDPE